MRTFGLQVDQLAPGVVCLHVEGEFDVHHVYEFDQELRALEDTGATTVVVDLREVPFVDSAGLSRLLAAQRRARSNGHRLAVVRGCRAIERLFALTAMNHTLELVSAPESVLAR